ncbi:Disease resistance protein RPM1 [Acorus gramineus]|uniref:Disease resistance protein RPM1 n=1 Tax=Acorus gramineus TaxID=55184 RepID=A0AAV9AWI6_ACOGR|nr:Disease resistance protein RPM1 [Acorus gramineus]
MTGGGAQRMVIAVLGMGGLGKTTLVSCVYNSHQVKKHFECAAWISVSRDTEPMDFLTSAAAQLFREEDSDADDTRSTTDLSTLARKINDYLRPRRYVIILDNVWGAEYANAIIDAAFPDNVRGSRIVITTRMEGVASILAHHTHNLECLNSEDALTLFCKKAFRRSSGRVLTGEFLHWAHRIISKCDGLPLAITAIGGLVSLQNTPEEWRRIHDSLDWNPNNNQELHRVNQVLMSSFDELPYYLRHCFLYCSMFPEGSSIRRKRLIRLWVAEGLVEERRGLTMEEVAEANLKELVFRSVLLVKETNECGRIKSFRVHDVVRELALAMAEEERFSEVFRGSQASSRCTEARRLSIHTTDHQFSRAIRMPSLRSFSVFGAATFSRLFPRGMMTSLGFKLLRVLELNGTPIESVPNEIFDLLNLRYLGLRGTNVRELPRSLERLRNLETLDVFNTEMSSLPCRISKLQSLRHLFIFNKIEARKHRITRFLFRSETLAGVWELKGLQTLRTISSNPEIARKIGGLTQMRSLSIIGVRSVHGMDLCASIAKMERLLRLCMIAANEPMREFLRLEYLSPPPPHLQKLILIGQMEGVPQWFFSLNNLTHLWLLDTQIGESKNPLQVLGSLPSLAHLTLDDAYKGRELRFPEHSFPALKVLYLSKMLRLVSVVILPGVMPGLRELYVRSCTELMEPLKGVHCLTKLQRMCLVLMPSEFIEKIRGARAAFKHVADVKHHYKGADGRWAVQLL